MPEFTHSESCQKRQAAAKAWKEQWPGHCKDCYGRGYHFHPATRYQPEDVDVCGCLETGTCPRCGKSIDLDTEAGTSTCPTCGWSDSHLLAGALYVEGLEMPDDSCDCYDRLDLDLETWSLFND